MRARAFATIAIWFANVATIGLLINSLTYRYIDYAQPLIGTYPSFGDQAAQTYTYYPEMMAFAPTTWIIAVAVLCFFIIIGSAIATSVIWRYASESEQSTPRSSRMIYGDGAVSAQSKKAKNDQLARAQRLVETLSPEELSELEYYYLSEQGKEPVESIQLESLMRQDQEARMRR